MNEIKIISVEAKNKYYVVTTNKDDYKFEEDTIVKYGIFNDKTFSIDEFNKIIKDNDNILAFNKVLRYLGYGPRSKKEIIKYLKEKGVTDYKVVINKLSEYGYIDDHKLANEIVAYYKNNNKGPLFILKKLNEKGIDAQTITKAIMQYDQQEERDICFEVGKKEVAKLSEYPIKKQKQSLYSKLVAKGFNIDVIHYVIEKVEYIDNSNEMLLKDYNKLLNKVAKKELSDNEKRNYIVNHLLAKGYEYSSIKSIL